MSNQQSDEAAKLAHRMAKAAGRVTPSVMAEACYMLICTACIAKDPSKFVDFLIKHDAKGSK